MKVPQTLADMLDNNAWKYPDETAFVWNDRRVTHAQFHNRVSRLASALRRLGLKRQDRVGILSQNSLEFQEVYGACEISGFICATVNWRLAIPEMVYIINDGSPKVMIFEAAYAETVAAMKDQLKTVEHTSASMVRWISHPGTKISSARAILWRAVSTDARRCGISHLHERDYRPAQGCHAVPARADRGG